MKIGYFADGPWAHRTLQGLLSNDSLEICFICLRYGSEDPFLAKMGHDNGIDVHVYPNINSDEFYCLAETYHPDLFVSMSFNQIFKKRILSLPPLGTINCHAGKLPFYRGRNILNWVLINDEKEFGITVHYVDEGIDTGDIILQETFPISDSDTYATLLERAYEGCAQLLCEAVGQILTGTARRICQIDIDPIGMYCGIRSDGDELINWSQNSRVVFNFIRAITRPGPGALSYIKGRPIIIYAARQVDGARSYINTPGQVVGKTKYGLYVKTLDTFLEVTDYQYDGKIQIGDRLKAKKETQINKMPPPRVPVIPNFSWAALRMSFSAPAQVSVA